MTESMYIGSGDTEALLSGKETKAFQKLMQRFTSGEKPYYNAKNSPIDALRTGAILEDRYFLTLPDDYFSQYRVQSKEMDVFRASVDFAKIENGNVADFDELKTCSFDDFMKVREMSEKEMIKKYKKYYNQVQEQLYCCELEEANLVFLSVYSYDDEENYNREVLENETMKFRIKRDESVISLIKERGEIFQTIKNYFAR